MPITGTVPPIKNLDQGIQEIDGNPHMLDDGDARWVYVNQGDVLYLSEDSEIIIYH
jgi:hypothetical protein